MTVAYIILLIILVSILVLCYVVKELEDRIKRLDSAVHTVNAFHTRDREL